MTAVHGLPHAVGSVGLSSIPSPLTAPIAGSILGRVSWRNWLPEIAQDRPRRAIRLSYLPVVQAAPADTASRVRAALAASGVLDVRQSGGSWQMVLPWRTLVYGLIRRDVEEMVDLRLMKGAGGHDWHLAVSCNPRETHAAHAAGAGGVLAVSGLVWIAAGWTAGAVPALTTLLAGGLWADTARVMALQVLERRLRRLIEDLGTAIWPGVPAEILPPPTQVGRGRRP